MVVSGAKGQSAPLTTMHAQRCPVAKLRAATQQQTEAQQKAQTAARTRPKPSKSSLLASLTGTKRKQGKQQGTRSQERPLSFFHNIHGDAAPLLPPRPQMYSDDAWPPTHTNTQAPTRIPPPPVHGLPPTHVLSPTRAMSPTRSVSPTRALSPTRVVPASRVLSPTAVVSPTGVVSPTRILSPTRVLSTTRVLSPTRGLSPTRALSPTRPPPPPTRTIQTTRAPSTNHTLSPTRAPPSNHNLPLTHIPLPPRVLSPTGKDTAGKGGRRRGGNEPLIYNEHCEVHGHNPRPRHPPIPKSPSFPAASRHTVSGERLKNWRRNSLTFSSQDCLDLDLLGPTPDPPASKVAPEPLSRPQRAREHQKHKTLSVGSGLVPPSVKGGSAVQDTSSRRSQFRRALSLFSIGCDDVPKEKPPPQRILRQPTRHTYRRGISGLPIECTTRHVGFAF